MTAMSLVAKLVLVVMSIVTVVSGECPLKCHCSKYKTFCSLVRLNSLPSQLALTTQHLRIELANITEISSTTGLRNLTHLELVKVQLKEIHPGAFFNLTKLEYLSVTHNNILVLKRQSFKYLENVYFLNLSHNGISDLDPGTFYGLINIRILDLGYNAIERLDANAFQGMRYNDRCSDIVMPIIDIEPAIYKYICTLKYFRLGEASLPTHISFGLSTLKNVYLTLAYKNIFNKCPGSLNYVEMLGCQLTSLLNLNFENLTEVTHFDLSYNLIEGINSGDFKFLISVKTLKLNHNKIISLIDQTFDGLKSLNRLEITHCGLETIEKNALHGLDNLKILDLRWNLLRTLENDTFSSLRMLRELKLGNNEIKKVDFRAFSSLIHLKSLTHYLNLSPLRLSGGVVYLNIPGRYVTICTTRGAVRLPATVKENFVDLERLDHLAFAARVSLPQDIQTLETLNLYLDAGSSNPEQELLSAMEIVPGVKNLNIVLLRINSSTNLSALSQFRISTLIISCSNLKILSRNFVGLPMLEILTMQDLKRSLIQEDAFNDMGSLTKLELYYRTELKYKQGSFYGLNNLKLLSIGPQNIVDFRAGVVKCLDERTFLGLENLTNLDLTGNDFTCLKPGAFLGLNKIEEILLSKNDISIIAAGVFGGDCKNKFNRSCINVTLSEYCNSTNALKTLKYLSLAGNHINYIHTEAFIGCANLHTLDLSDNYLTTLDEPFLFTPALKVLNLKFNDIQHISTNFFECTPLLSDIDFSRNTNMKNLNIRSLHYLKHLKLIDLTYSPIVCDCNFFETWFWMIQRRVHYITRISQIFNKSVCSDTDVDKALYNMNCNISIKAALGEKVNSRIPSFVHPNSEEFNFTQSFKFYSFFKRYIEPIVLIIILLFGLTCNGFLLFVSLRHSDMRRKENLCIIHLAAVDVLSLLLNLALSYLDAVNISWEFDTTLCKIFIVSKDIIVGVAVLSIVALSAERYLVTRKFKNLKKICKSECPLVVWLLTTTWISAVVTSLPAYYSATVDFRCLYCPPGNKVYIRNILSFQFIMYCVLPAIAVTFLNVKTCNFLRESVRNIPGEIKDNYRSRNRIKVANMVIILVVVFVISYLPSYTVRLLVAWSVLDLEDLFLGSFFTFCLFFCYAVVNPISIFIMSSKFKDHALSYFPFLEKSENSSSPCSCVGLAHKAISV